MSSMNEFWLFAITLVLCGIWLAIAGPAIRWLDYLADHAGGWFIGLTREQVNEMRRWQERK